MEFEYDLSESGQFEYHYELICKSWAGASAELYNLGRNFHKHGSKGLDFLFDRMNTQKEWCAEIAYLIAYNLENMKTSCDYRIYCDKLIPYLLSDIKVDSIERKRKAIIALGWVGTSREVSALCKILLSDNDPKCRAWAATSIMQMSFHRVSLKSLTKDEVLVTFKQALIAETDLFVLGCSILTVQELCGKRWISGNAIENLQTEKIGKAQRAAINFLTKKISD